MITENTKRAGGQDSAGAEPGSTSLKHQAYVELKRQILSGRLAPGMMLSERQLAGELKMSKTPIHAALERLEADGLVTVAAQQGITVRAISPQDVADHFEIREALEPFVVERLAGRLTSGQILRLERNLVENREAVRDENIGDNVRIDAEFHLLLCEYLGNREITRVMAQNREKVHSVIHQISSRLPARMAVSLAEHESIVEAIVSGDRTAAVGRMKAHLRYGLQCVYARDA